MNILLVEDSATLRYAMSNYVRSAGHEPVIAECGEEALQIAEHTPVDMIIMDVQMPGLDGFETTRLIREWLGNHWIPIIFVTGKSDDEDLREGIEAGGDDYLIKPVSEVILHAKIRAMERITTMRDQMARLNEELMTLSQTDGLTGLLNRRTFEMKAQEAWRQATREKTPLAVILMDVDHFKPFNDYYGHPAGDDCLRAIADVMKSCINRPADLVARYGGEEFVALLTNTPEDGALHVAEEIRQQVESLNVRHRASPSDTRVTLSVGVSATAVTTGTSLTQQIQRADKALYIAKKNGRNCLHLDTYSPHGRVLVVDDQQESFDTISRYLDGHCGLVKAASGSECRRIAEETPVDLILLNAAITTENSDQLCRGLRLDPITAELPIIIFGIDGQTQPQQYAKSVMANAGLEDPVDPHRLVALVDQLMN